LRQQLEWLLNARDGAAIAALLDDLTEYLALHFAAEERSGGLLEYLADCTPYRATRVAELRCEHDAITASVIEVRGIIVAPFERASPRLLREVQHLVATVLAHEGTEEYLLQEALGRDLGDSD
jgi:hemerythrin